MTLFDAPDFAGHEIVEAVYDEAAGLKAVIAAHSTARGPAAGGCRMRPYASAAEALADALRLSRAMSYKNAMADIPLGGGKAVIIADPRTDKTPELFEAFGRAVDSLGGRYWTAEDVGVSPGDLAAARRTTPYVAGLEGHKAASGDPSPVTAEGVFRGLRIALRLRLGRDVDGARVAVQGAGHVGLPLIERLLAAGASVTTCDPDPERARRAAALGAKVVGTDAIFDVDADVFAPCALGGAVSLETLARQTAPVIAGAANNQLADAAAGERLHREGRLYAPDYVINGGGIINVAAEILALRDDAAFDPSWVATKLDRLMETLEEILRQAMEEGRPTHVVADDLASARLAEARRARA